MTQEKYLAALSELFDSALVLTKAKSTDYAGPDDAFANFQLVETLTQGKVTAEMGIVVRMSDKLQRISNLLLAGKAEVKDERVSDTCKDLMIYAAILHIMTQHSEVMEGLEAALKQKPVHFEGCDGTLCCPSSTPLKDYCCDVEPVSGYSCCLPKGHTGRHIACNSISGKHNLGSWPQKLMANYPPITTNTIHGEPV